MVDDGLEGSMIRNPWLTICNVLWGNRLAAIPHNISTGPVLFSSLWSSGETFTELYRLGRMENSLYDIVMLLLSSNTIRPLEAMLNEGILTWDRKFRGNVTLAHVVCALNSVAAQLMFKNIPQNGLWTTKDHQDQDPLAVCFSAELRKSISKHVKGLNGKHKNTPITDLELTFEIKQRIFDLASSPEGLYDLAILLQKYEFDVNQEKNEKGDLLIHTVVEGGLPCLAHLFYIVNQHRADVTLPNDQGLTPVCLATQIGDEKLTELFICVFGAGVNSTDINEKWTPLHYAARYDHPNLISMLLERGADLNKEDKNDRIPEYVAQKFGAEECQQLLSHHIEERGNRLAEQANEGTLDTERLFSSDISYVTADGFTLLMKAVLGNHPSTVRDLLNKNGCPINCRQLKVDNLKTALSIAAENGFSECLRILLEAGANPSIDDSMKWLPLHHATDNNHKECVRIILSHQKGLTGLKLAQSLAEKNGRADITQCICDAMSRRQKDIVNPTLLDVAITGDKDSLYQLLEDGDDVNPSNDVSDWPLYIAASFGHLEVVKLLFESGGFVVKHHSLNLSTPLHTAARGGHVEVIRFLLEFCRPNKLTYQSEDIHKSYLDINEKNAMGTTPLELAASLGHMSVVRVLLDNGAVTTLPDSNGCLLTCPAFCGIQFFIESRRKEQMDRIIRALKEQKPLKEFRALWKGPSDFNLRDTQGDTVLMLSARYAKPDIMDFLLQSAVLFTPDMKINWKTKRVPISPPRSPQYTYNALEESLPSDSMMYPSRRNDYQDLVRPVTVMAGRYNTNPRRRRRGYRTTDSEDDDFSFSGEYQSRVGEVPQDPPPQMNAYMNVTIVNPGPCTQSGIICLTNIHDRRSALHRAVEGNQPKIIPLLLSADPNVANIQDKNGRSALHLACDSNSKKCILALLSVPNAAVDALLRDAKNYLAEDVAIQPRLKKKVNSYRIKQMKDNRPANRPLPPTPQQPNPPPPPPPPPSQTPPSRMDYNQAPLYMRRDSPYNNVYPSNYLPTVINPLPPTREDDTHSVYSTRSNRRRPRYIQTPLQRTPHSQSLMTIIPGNGPYNRVRNVPVSRNHGSSGSDIESSGQYSRLQPRIRSPPAPPVPAQNFVPVPPSPSRSTDSTHAMNIRVSNLRNVVYEEDSNPEYSDS